MAQHHAVSVSGKDMSSTSPAGSTTTTTTLHLDGEQVDFDNLFLRDACTCPVCVDVSSGQKNFSTFDIADTIQPRSIQQDGDKVAITWNDDLADYDSSHTTILDTEFLRTAGDYGDSISGTAKRGSRKRHRPAEENIPQLPWTNASISTSVPTLDYESYLTSDSTLDEALLSLRAHGLLFLSNVPESPSSVETVAQRIGPLKTTFYGKTWSVKSVPSAINVAYTHQDLGFHMDLMYMAQPPRLQLLHCLRSSARGGVSLFSDGLAAVERMLFPALAVKGGGGSGGEEIEVGKAEREGEEAFKTLCTLDSHWHYNTDGHAYRQSRPAIELKKGSPSIEGIIEEVKRERQRRKGRRVPPPGGEQGVDSNSAAGEGCSEGAGVLAKYIDVINYSPPFQAPFLSTTTTSTSTSTTSPPPPPHQTIRAWTRAHRQLRSAIESPSSIYARRLEPGDCVIFDNRRVLHARTAFEPGDAGQERWLQGAYLDWDVWVSKLRSRLFKT